jgi:type II secretory pathway component HofQ
MATTAEVVPGLTIRQQQAEAWLQSDAAEAAHAQFVAEKPVVVGTAEPEVELASQPIQLLNAICHHRELPQLQRSLTAEQLSVFPAAFRAPVVAPAATRPTNDSSTGQDCRMCFASTIGNGKALRYSKRNWGCRWQVEGHGTGWWLQLDGQA